MADNKLNAADEIALELFKGRSRNGLPSELARAVALSCYRDAKMFLQAREEIQSGTVDPFADDKNPLDQAFAPNLPKTSPWNLMSREYGSLQKVQSISRWLNDHPTATEYEDLGWKPAEVRAARDLFPGVLSRASKMGVLN